MKRYILLLLIIALGLGCVDPPKQEIPATVSTTKAVTPTITSSPTTASVQTLIQYDDAKYKAWSRNVTLHEMTDLINNVGDDFDIYEIEKSAKIVKDKTQIYLDELNNFNLSSELKSEAENLKNELINYNLAATNFELYGKTYRLNKSLNRTYYNNGIAYIENVTRAYDSVLHRPPRYR